MKWLKSSSLSCGKQSTPQSLGTWELFFQAHIFSKPCPTQKKFFASKEKEDLLKRNIPAPSHYTYVQLLTNCTAR